ncbi:MAG: glutamate synthase [Anaerolineales bacterium]|nr:glutamate synthase [Anaerolineales bacterium]
MNQRTTLTDLFPGISTHSWLSGDPDSPYLDEHDACAIVASIRKGGVATHGNLKRVLNALSKMGHRSGDVNGEGDGCGVMTDIPRLIWADALEEAGKPGWLAEDRRFFVGHLMIPRESETEQRKIVQKILHLTRNAGADLLISRAGHTRPHALGKLAREQEPLFWQLAGVMSLSALEAVDRKLFDLTLAIERDTPAHVVSLSSHSVVYKVRGSVETLYHYYPELRSPQFTSAITLGHTRYSTNTTTAFERVQPFSYLGHNGEINTIARLREQARMIGTQLVHQGSDSQDLDRALGTLIHHYHFTLSEAMEILLPPILSEVAKFPAEAQQVYHHYREAFGPFAQGPAGLISRYADEAVFSVDALGLRPLWFGETDKEYFFSSEKGVYYLESLANDPRPLSPGEKMALHVHRNRTVDVYEYPALQTLLVQLARRRLPSPTPPSSLTSSPLPLFSPGPTPSPRLLAALGWSREDLEWVKSLADNGSDPLGSLGYDGPLAALSDQRQNVSDYFKEAVAVVTNPAIDREREKEHFSTRAVIGTRPSLHPNSESLAFHITLDCPILLDNTPDNPLLPSDRLAELVTRQGTRTLESLLASFGDRASVLSTLPQPDENIPNALDRLAEAALDAAKAGASLIVLDDSQAFQNGNSWLDPHLIVSVVDRALRLSFLEIPAADEPQPLFTDAAGQIDLAQILAPNPVNLRRQVGIVLRSGAIRNLHDVMMALGVGADAIAPSLLFENAVDDPRRQLSEPERFTRLQKTFRALRAGIEKVTSTMGIHELRGYGRIFASIGLGEDVALAMGTANYYGSQKQGLTWHALQTDLEERKMVVAGDGQGNLSRTNHFYPKIWKTAGQVATGSTPVGDAEPNAFELKAEATARQIPVTLRHILDFDFPAQQGGVDFANDDFGRVPFKSTPPGKIDPDEVDAGITSHSLPFVIASMSFGSQSEIAFRAYAEGAARLNMLSVNGEGGEIPDMLGKYPHHRGQQIASGRFGVDINLINSSNLLEIKVGQGAKPGEGGHLPGRKVSAKVAGARHARQGVDLISPSNNHDIYSIEDLAQFIEELKTANPKARVAVKVPVVPGIGIIAVGIAKAGADIINLTGYDGGTGAARKHSLRYVGLPAEIGVVEAHRALTEGGMRGRVEIWADGGMRTAADAVKMMLLGANRVGFGTLAMVAVGCTICRACQMDTCHVGIATQIETVAQAEAHGLKRFVPQDFERATQGIVSLFGALGREVKAITARLGFARTQDLVGRADLLVQISHHARLDLGEMLEVAECPDEESTATRLLKLSSGVQVSQRPLRRPRNHLTTVISNMMIETALAGEENISFEDDKVSPVDRVLGTHLAGALTRFQRRWIWAPGHGGVGGCADAWQHQAEVMFNGNGSSGSHHPAHHPAQVGIAEAVPVATNGNGHGANGHAENIHAENGHFENGHSAHGHPVKSSIQETNLRFYASSVPGNGLGAYATNPMHIAVEGGAQDGVGKGMHGGKIVILKGYNHDGERVDGSVGKGLAYGAIGGLIVVQGNADSRACIRLSGADVILGGEIRQPLNDNLGYIGARANVKGFLCEYMTAGRVLVMGDPGPWMCAGMTGGVLYLRLQPQKNFDLGAIQRRVARGANVRISNVDEEDEANLAYLLSAYSDELSRGHQVREAEQVLDLLQVWDREFVRVEPSNLQMDQSVSTE